jgi:uncharacterized protein YndB with AHSA1/START domain
LDIILKPAVRFTAIFILIKIWTKQMSNSPNISMLSKVEISASVDKVWKTLTEKKQLEKWLCNSVEASLTPGSDWNPLGVNFWGGDLFVLISNENQQLVLRWALEGYQSILQFQLNHLDEARCELSLKIESPANAELGFPDGIPNESGLKSLWKYHLYQIKLISEDITIPHRVDILKPEGLAIRLIYHTSKNPELTSKCFMTELFTPQSVENYLNHISNLTATGTAENGMDLISWDLTEENTLVSSPVSISKMSDNYYIITTRSKVNPSPVHIEFSEDHIEIKQDGFDKNAELQNLFEIEWSTLMYQIKYYSLKQTSIRKWDFT